MAGMTKVVYPQALLMARYLFAADSSTVHLLAFWPGDWHLCNAACAVSVHDIIFHLQLTRALTCFLAW